VSNDSNTVAIYLLKNKIDVPEEWKYNPEYKITTKINNKKDE